MNIRTGKHVVREWFEKKISTYLSVFDDMDFATKKTRLYRSESAFDVERWLATAPPARGACLDYLNYPELAFCNNKNGNVMESKKQREQINEPMIIE